MQTMQVATKIPVELVKRLDRRLARTMSTRSQWMRDAILRQAEADGLLKVLFDDAGDVYELEIAGAVA